MSGDGTSGRAAMKKKRETADFAGIGFRCLHFYAHADVEEIYGIAGNCLQMY